MNIEEQVELLMQGTEYGDEELKKAGSCACIAASIPPTLIFI